MNVNDALAQESAREDLLWLGKVKEGNMGAFNWLVRKYQRRIYAIIYNITSNKEDTADLTQEVFIKAFKSIDSFKGSSNFYTWLYRIALNTALSFVKKHRRTPVYSLEDWDSVDDPKHIINDIVGVSDGNRRVLLKELQEKLNEALQKLSLSHRTVIILFEIEGMSHAEIAEVLKCSEGTVRSRLHYAKEQLKNFLSGYLNEK